LFNGAVADGKVGLVTRGGTTSVDQFEIRTDDEFFRNAPPQPPVARISDASIAEGNSGSTAGSVTFTLSSPLASATTIGYRTITGTATAGSDYTAVSSGTVTIAAGAMSVQIPLTISGDTTYEPDETFTVQITSAPGLNLADGFGSVTIVNDDVAVSVAATDASGAEAGSDPIVFTVTRVGSASGTTAANLSWSGTAANGTDYTLAASGATLSGSTLTFAAGATTATLTVRPVD